MHFVLTRLGRLTTFELILYKHYKKGKQKHIRRSLISLISRSGSPKRLSHSFENISSDQPTVKPALDNRVKN